MDNLFTVAITNLTVHFSWVHHQLPGMTVWDEADFILVDSGLPCDTFNAVCRARLMPDNASEHIQAVNAYFADVQYPFSWWVNPGDEPGNLGQLLINNGLHEAETELAMGMDLNQLKDDWLLPDGLVIRRVCTKQQLQDFAQIVAANWTPPDEDVVRFYDLAAPVLLTEDAPLWLYIGYLGETPVATSELTVGGGVVGLYNICTLMAYRRRGIGYAMTLQPLLEAQSVGFHTAILQASDEGSSVYQKIGFEVFGQVTEYKP
jgi:ribosomal protein S18 acetylase RimI-like enzyme